MRIARVFIELHCAKKRQHLPHAVLLPGEQVAEEHARDAACTEPSGSACRQMNGYGSSVATRSYTG